MIEFLYFEGCPNAKETLNNLYELVNDGLIDKNEISVIEVPDMIKAKEHCFQGSPTILFKGIDIYTKKRPVGVQYSCRIYNIPGAQTGILTKEYIIAAINELKI